MNPVTLYALVFRMTMKGDPVCGLGQRAILYTDEQAAHNAGVKLKETKPAEAETFEFTVIPLEGDPFSS